MSKKKPVAPKEGLRANGKFYAEGERIPVKYFRSLNTARATDKSAASPEMPPNFGRQVLPHTGTFQGMVRTASHSYYTSDEALRDSRQNSLRMRRDCFIMECLEARQRSVALLNWHLEPENRKSADQVELSDLLTNILKKTPRFMELRRNLLEATWFGRYAVQLEYGAVYVDGKRYWGIKDWTPIHGDKLAFRYDDGSGEYDKNQVGIRVSGNFMAGDLLQGSRRLESTEWGLAYFLEKWEQELIAVHKHMIEDAAFDDYRSAGSIHGVGIRDRIYWTWIQMQESLGQLMDLIERTGQGIWIYYYPYGDDNARKKVEDLANNENRSNRVIMPRMSGDPAMDSFGIDRIDPSPAGIQLLKDIVLGLFGHRIKRYILGQILSSESEATGLGSGVADLHHDTMLQIVKYDATGLEETITHSLVNNIKQINFYEAKNIDVYYKIDTESAEADKKLEAMNKAFQMGMKIKASDVYDAIGMSEPTDDDVILQHPMFRDQQPGQPGQQPGGSFAPGQAALGGQPGSGAGIAGPNGENLHDLFGPLAKRDPNTGRFSYEQAQPVPGQQQPAGPMQYQRNGVPLFYKNMDELDAGSDLPSTPAPAKLEPIENETAAAGAPNATAIPIAATVEKSPIADAPAPVQNPDSPAENKNDQHAPDATKSAAEQPQSQQSEQATSLPAGHPGLPSELSNDNPPTVGEVRQAGGSEYRFNENHHWESANKSESSDNKSDLPAEGGQVDVANPPEPTPGPDLKSRQAFTKTKLNQIHTGASGVIRAMQASPQFQNGGEYSTHDFAPSQVQSLHKEFAGKVGQIYGGGRVVDLSQTYGAGAIGFSSPAGAMVLVPPTTQGQGAKWKVNYTAMTGPVARAMQGKRDPLDMSDLHEGIKSKQPQTGGQTQAQVQPQTQPTGPVPPAGQANPAKPSLKEKVLDAIDRGVTGAINNTIGERPLDAMEDKFQAGVKKAKNLLSDPESRKALVEKVISKLTGSGKTKSNPVAPLPEGQSMEGSQPAGNGEQPAADQPQPAGQPQPTTPTPHDQARENADNIRLHLNDLTKAWNDHTKAGDLTTKQHSWYRSQVAALKSQLSVADKEAARLGATSGAKQGEQLSPTATTPNGSPSAPTASPALNEAEQKEIAKKFGLTPDQINNLTPAAGPIDLAHHKSNILKTLHKALGIQDEIEKLKEVPQSEGTKSLMDKLYSGESNTKDAGAKQLETNRKLAERKNEEQESNQDFHNLTRKEFSAKTGLPESKHKKFVDEFVKSKGLAGWNSLPESVKSEYHEVGSRVIRNEAAVKRAMDFINEKPPTVSNLSATQQRDLLNDRAFLKAAKRMTNEQLDAMQPDDIKAMVIQTKSDFDKRKADDAERELAAKKQLIETANKESDEKTKLQRYEQIEQMGPQKRAAMESIIGFDHGKSELDKVGLPSTEKVKGHLVKLVADGVLRNKADLEKVVGQVKSDIEKTGKSASGEEMLSAIEKRARQHEDSILRESPKRAIANAAKENDVSESDLNDAIDEVHKGRNEIAQEKEKDKKSLRASFGLNAADVARLENGGKDWDKIKGIDTVVASEYPNLFQGGGYANPEEVWKALREGVTPPLARHSPEVIKEAVELLKSWGGANGNEQGGDGSGDNSVPFSREQHPSRRTAIAILYQRKRHPDLFPF